MKKILIALLFCAASIFADDNLDLPEFNGTLVYRGKEYKYGIALTYTPYGMTRPINTRSERHCGDFEFWNSPHLLIYTAFSNGTHISDPVSENYKETLNYYNLSQYPENPGLDDEFFNIMVRELKKCYDYYKKKKPKIWDLDYVGFGWSHNMINNDEPIFIVYNIMPDLLPDYY